MERLNMFLNYSVYEMKWRTIKILRTRFDELLDILIFVQLVLVHFVLNYANYAIFSCLLSSAKSRLYRK